MEPKLSLLAREAMWRTEALRNVNLLQLHQLTMVERRSWWLEEEPEEEVGEQEEDESLDGEKYKWDHHWWLMMMSRWRWWLMTTPWRWRRGGWATWASSCRQLGTRPSPGRQSPGSPEDIIVTCRFFVTLIPGNRCRGMLASEDRACQNQRSSGPPRSTMPASSCQDETTSNFHHLKGKEVVAVPSPRAGGEGLQYFCWLLHHVTDPVEVLVLNMQLLKNKI